MIRGPSAPFATRFTALRATQDAASFHKELSWVYLRPAVISQETATAIDEFRRFRHLVRNVYPMNLEPEKMSRLIEALPELWPKLRAEMLAFADYLEALDESLS